MQHFTSPLRVRSRPFHASFCSQTDPYWGTCKLIPAGLGQVAGVQHRMVHAHLWCMEDAPPVRMDETKLQTEQYHTLQRMLSGWDASLFCEQEWLLVVPLL